VLRFTVTTIGCKVNQYETRAAAALLERLGLAEVHPSERTDHPAPVDLVVVNTCCVTSAAAAKSRRAIRRAVRRHPAADVLILGCYATQAPSVLGQLPVQAGTAGTVHVAGHDQDVAARIRRIAASPRRSNASGAGDAPPPRSGNADAAVRPSEGSRGPAASDGGRNASIASLPAGSVRNDRSMRASPSQHPTKQPPVLDDDSAIYSQPRGDRQVKHNMGTAGLPPIARFAGHQRAFVKVQDGCDAACSYCVIPRLRRRVWSRPMDRVLAEVRGLVAAGHREVVLCGVFLGAYGQETAVRSRWRGPSALPELLARVADVPGLWRVRLSSLEAGDVTDELLDVFRARPNVAPHLHLSLQSGSATVLRRMNRPYGPEQFLQAVGRIRRALDDAAITTDVIVGFPDETEEDFADTLRVAREARFSKIHAFGFSPRPGTAAWRWRGHGPSRATVKARLARLAEQERLSARAFRRRFLGRTVEALVEEPNAHTPPGHLRGLTDRYLEVAFRPAGTDDSEPLIGRVVRVRVTGLSETGLLGTAEAREGL